MKDISLPADFDGMDSQYYLRALTEMADRRAVVADAAIYSSSGIKLVEKGARIDNRLYERLVQHKLREPIDRYLTVENPVNASALMVAAQELVEQVPLLTMLAKSLGALSDRLLSPLRSLPLPSSIACKLTVMREQRPELFRHSLQMVVVAVFLGLRSDMGERDCTSLAAAALLHDLGVLHMDPAWNDPDYKVVGPQRRHLVAHPITAMLMMRDTQSYTRAAEIAVLEHHERMDESGYPRGLAGADITPMGRILMLAEVVTAFFEKYDDMPAQRLSLMLRLNHRKFPADLVAHILPLLQAYAAQEARSLPDAHDVQQQIELLEETFAGWDKIKASLSDTLQPGKDGPFAFTDARLQGLHKALLEAGSHPRQLKYMLPHLQGDPVSLSEVWLVAKEAIWQLQTVVNACHRRWPKLQERTTPAEAAVADWCAWTEQRL